MNLAQNPAISSKFRTKIDKNRLTRLPSGLFFQNAPKEIHFELYNITIRQNRNLSLMARICKWTVKFTVSDRTINNYKPLQLYLQ